MKHQCNGLKYLLLNLFKVVLVLATLSLVSGCERKSWPQRGDASPDFSATEINGSPVLLSQLKGKIVILYFWTNSCCGRSLQRFEPFYRSHEQRGMAFLAINVGDSREVVASYAKETGVTFTLLADAQKRISEQFGVIGFPTIYILDKNGVIREKIQGEIQPEQMEKLVKRQFAMQKEAESSYEKIHGR